MRGRVEFRGVSFSSGDERVLEDLSFVAEPGQTVGIIGPTGSGKSSIGHLLCRYYASIRGLRGERTVIVIAHRVSSSTGRTARAR